MFVAGAGMTRTGRLLTPEIKAQILAEAKEPGANRSAVAEKWGVSRAFIYLLLNPVAFAAPKPVDLISSHEIQKLRRTLRLSLRQFADLLGVSEATIRGWEAPESEGWQPRAASRYRLLQIATEHGIPLEFLNSTLSVKAAGIVIKDPFDFHKRRELSRAKQKQIRQDFRKRIVEPPPAPVPQAPPPKTVTVGNRDAFRRASEMFKF